MKGVSGRVETEAKEAHVVESRAKVELAAVKRLGTEGLDRSGEDGGMNSLVALDSLDLLEDDVSLHLVEAGVDHVGEAELLERFLCEGDQRASRE